MKEVKKCKNCTRFTEYDSGRKQEKSDKHGKRIDGVCTYKMECFHVACDDYCAVFKRKDGVK